MHSFRISTSVLSRQVLSRVVASALALLVSSPIFAQTPLRILRYSPTDTAASGSIVTVTFSRPVAGLLDQTIDARKVMSVRPAAEGTFEWRDPITLRFIPNEPLAPGTRLNVAVDTAAIASSGARTGAQFEFAIQVPGPRRLSTLVDGEEVGGESFLIGPHPTFRLMYSGAVNVDSVAKVSRIEFPANCGGTIPLRVVLERPFKNGDPLSYRYDWNRDSLSRKFWRVVEMVPSESFRPSCRGQWVVPLFNEENQKATVSHAVLTYPEFRVDSISGCVRGTNACDPNGLAAWFSAPMQADVIASRIRVSPELTLATRSGRSRVFAFTGRLISKSRYTVSIDTSVRDVFGRPLVGPTTMSVVARNRPSGIKHQSSLVSLVASSPVFKVRTVNVDTLTMYLKEIPDSLTPAVLRPSHTFQFSGIDEVVRPLPQLAAVDVPVNGTFNSETEVSVELPAQFVQRARRGLLAVRFGIKAASIDPDSVSVLTARRADSARVIASKAKPDNTGEPSYGLLAQVSNLRVHSKLNGNQGVVLVTDASGKTVDGATIALFDENHRQFAHATTDKGGLATLVSTPRAVIDSWPPVVRQIGRTGRTRYLEARYNGDRLIASLEAPQSNSLNAQFDRQSLGVHVAAGGYTHSALFTDRGVYRPGEMIHVKAYIRHGVPGSISTKSADSIRLRLSWPNGDQDDDDDKHTFALNEFGSAVDSIRLAQDAHTGQYTIDADVRVDGIWTPLWTQTEFRVAEFRAPEFLVKVTPVAEHSARDSIQLSVSATYLFGAPMAGATVKWTAIAEDEVESIPAIPNTTGYTIGQSMWWDSALHTDYINVGAKDSLNSSGKLRLMVPVAESRGKGLPRMTVEVAVVDVNNQTVTASTSVSLHSTSLFIAARDRGESWYWRTGQLQTLDAFVVRKNGMRASNVPMSVTIRRWRWRVDTTRSDAQGRWTVDTVRSLRVVSSDVAVPITFTPTTDGAYDVRIEARDEFDRPAITNLGRWSLVNSWAQTYEANPLKLRVVADRHDGRQYSFGDTARISFESPFNRAIAWVTLEREGVVEQRTMMVVRGTSSLKVPVTRRFAPNIWVGVTLIAQRDSTVANADAVHQELRAGYVEIRVDSTANALRVAVKPLRNTLAPGDLAQVRVEVKEARSARGVRSEVALWAVDEGVLSLTGYKTPDILSALDERQGVSSSLYSTLAQFPWRSSVGPVSAGINFHVPYDPNSVNRLSEVAVGRAPGVSLLSEAVQGVRSEFRHTAFFVGRAITDTNGVVTIQRKLPDNITTFRLMATAVTTGERYGSGQASLLVTRQVVVRPSLPRFVRLGDSLAVDAALSLRDTAPAELTVRARIDNKMLRGDSVQTVAIRSGRSERANFRMVVPEQSIVDSVKVRLAAANVASGKSDAVESVIPIRPAGTPRAYTAIGVVRDSGTIMVTLPGDIDPARSTFSVSLGTSPLVAMRANLARLRNYGNYSTELLVTTARSLLSLARAERSMGDIIVTRDSSSTKTDLQHAVNELAKREVDDDGYFSNWPNSKRAETVWFSAYIGLFLLDAQADGVDVPDYLIERISDRLSYAFTNPKWRDDSLSVEPENRRYWLLCKTGDRLASLKFLRTAGKPLPASEDSLLAQSKDLFWEDRVSLTEMLSERKELQPQLRVMLEDAWRGVSVAGKRLDMPDSVRNNNWFPSHVRPAARLLTATLKLLPEHKLLGALSESIIQQGSVENGWAWNSMDYGSAVEALGEFVVTQRGNTKGTVVARDANGRVVFSRSTASASSVAMTAVEPVQSTSGLLRTVGSDSSMLKLNIRLETEGTGAVASRNAPLYYSVTVNEVPLRRPTTPDAAGLTIERWYERFEDGKPVTEVKEGDLVRVRMRITVPSDRQYVAVEDLLPAGLEIVDLSMRTSAAIGPFAKANATRHPAFGRDEGDDEGEEGGPFGNLATGGTWDNGWWSPWEYKEARDDRAFYFARQLWSGTYGITYLARATTVGTFVKPPAHAEEMYNRALQGRSDGGTFVVRR